MDQELTKARLALEGDLVEHQQEIADLATENERQLETIEAQAKQLEILGAEKAAADGKAAQLAADLVEAREMASRERMAVELARTEFAKAQLRLEMLPRLENDLVGTRHKLENERLVKFQAEQAAAVLTAQKADLEARLLDWKGQVDRGGEQLVKAQERAERLATSLESERKARIAAEQSAAVLSAQKADLESRVADGRAHVTQIEEQLMKSQERANRHS